MSNSINDKVLSYFTFTLIHAKKKRLRTKYCRLDYSFKLETTISVQVIFKEIPFFQNT